MVMLESKVFGTQVMKTPYSKANLAWNQHCGSWSLSATIH